MRAMTVAAVLALLALAATPATASAQPDRGKELYEEGCRSCHGQDGRGEQGTGPAIGAGGVQGAGPSLRGAGRAAVDLYLSTGYMPLDEPGDVPHRKRPRYSREQIEALADYIESIGPGGPPVPKPDPESGDVAEGMRAFTAQCAGCHQVAAEGGVVLDGTAPELERATPTQIAEAVRVGPYLMPSFGEEQISDDELDSIIRYVQYTKAPRDEGGWGIGHIGPIPEGFVAWLVAALALVGVARLIGKRIGT